MTDQTKKCFLYARKSTDEAARQVLSIEAQLYELRQYAKREGLNVVREFVESKTAKMPGREVFNTMIAGIEEGIAAGILAWHPDRLARNSVDGGRIIYLVDTGKIQTLKFPTFWFDATPQGKFMLSIAFGQSKYYVDNLSENTKRGIRQKLRNGIWPTYAPTGYLNDKNKRYIIVDKDKAPLIRKAFELYASGEYPLSYVRKAINSLGLIGREKKPMSTSNYQYILRNPIYYGAMRYREELFAGTHEPIITKKLFERVQAVMSNKSKPKTPKLKPYPYRGLFRCGECGCFITTETQKGHNYLRCTKRKDPCSQPYVREEAITAQIRTGVQKVSLCSDWADKMIAEIEKEKATTAQSEGSFAQKLRDQIVTCQERLDRLLDMRLDGSLTQEEYAAKKQGLVEDKITLGEKLSAFERKGHNRFEPMVAFIKAANQAGCVALQENPVNGRDFLKKIGSNFLIAERALSFDFVMPWKILTNYQNAQHAALLNPGKTAEQPKWLPD